MGKSSSLSGFKNLGCSRMVVEPRSPQQVTIISLTGKSKECKINDLGKSEHDYEHDYEHD